MQEQKKTKRETQLHQSQILEFGLNAQAKKSEVWPEGPNLSSPFLPILRNYASKLPIQEKRIRVRRTETLSLEQLHEPFEQE